MSRGRIPNLRRLLPLGHKAHLGTPGMCAPPLCVGTQKGTEARMCFCCLGGFTVFVLCLLFFSFARLQICETTLCGFGLSMCVLGAPTQRTSRHRDALMRVKFALTGANFAQHTRLNVISGFHKSSCKQVEHR